MEHPSKENNKYRALFEHSQTALFITKPDGTILEANSAACQLFGYSEEELKKLGRDGVIDPDSPGLKEKLDEREKSGSTSGEVIGIRKSGEKFWCEFSSSLFDDPEDGKLASIMLSDISDSKETQESLKEVMNNVPGVLYRYVSEPDGSEKLQFVSGGVKEVLGFTPDEIFEDLSLGWKNVHKDDVEAVVQSIKESAEKNRRWVSEYRYHHPDGSIRWLRGMGKPVSNKNGRVVWDSIVIDITEEKQAELDLKLMESVATEANDAVLITKGEPIEAPDGPEIIYVNRAFEKMSGYKAEEVIGKTPRILQGSYTGSKQLQQLRGAVRKRKNVEVELLNYNKSGEEYWVNISLSPIFEGEKCTHFISIQKDVTDRKLREIQKSLSAEISRIFNRKKSVRDALQSSMDEIATLKFFDSVEFWLVDRDQTVMNMVAYTIGKPAIADFYAKGKKIETFKKSEGLPGTTWEKKENLFWRNLDRRKTFIRREEAANAGLKTAFSFPVMNSGDVRGALVLLVSEDLVKERFYIGLFKELSDQLAAEIKRKELEEELSRIFNSAPDVICIAGLDGYYKKVNPAMSKLLGYSEEELLTTPILDFVHPGDRQKTKSEFEALNKGEGKHYFENRHITKSGQVVWLSWTTKPFYDEGITYSVAKEITDEKELRELFSQVNRLARIGGWEVDLANDEHHWSDMTREIHEVGPDYKPKLSSAINFYKEGESRKRIEEAVDLAIQQGGGFDLEVQIITAKGSERWIRAIGEAEHVDGKCVRLFGSFQDIHERKSVEMRLKNISNNIPGVLFQYVIGDDGSDQLFYVSEGSDELWGFTPEEVMNDNDLIWNRFHKDDFEKVNESILNSARSLSKWQSQWRYYHPNGSIRWHEGFGTPHKSADGSVVWDSIIMDVTEKKKLEELVEQTTRLAKVGSWEVDLRRKNNVMYWSDITREILEVNERDEITLEGMLDFYKSESKKRAQKAVEKTLKSGESFDLELMVTTAKGRDRWIRSIGQVEFEDGKPVRMYGSYQDIHHRKVAELAYKETLEEKNRILESISDAFYAIDENWNITYFNSEAENMLNKKWKDVVGNSIWNEFPAAKDTELYNNYREVMEKREPQNFDYYYPPLDSWYDISAYPAEKGISVYFKNIDERKEAEKRILEKTLQLDAIAEFNSLLIQRESWLEALDESLESFGIVADADRAYFFENRTDEEGRFIDTSMRLEWVRKGVKPELNNPAHHSQKLDDIREYYEYLSANQPYNMTVSEMADPDFKDLLKSQNIKSLLLVPVFIGQKFTGFLGFDDCRDERKWEEEEISLLQTISINLASAIENEDAKKALQKAYEDKNTILESIDDGFFTLNRDWIVTYWNNRAEELLHTPKEKIVGENLWVVFEDATDLPSFINYHKVMNEGVSLSFEDYYEPIDRWFDINAYPSDEGISVYFKDITKRKENSEKIRQINERFEKVTKATNDAIWDFDVQNENLYWGKGFETLFGYELKNINPSLEFLISLIHPDDRERVFKKINHYMRDTSKTDWFEEYRFQRENGSYAYVMDRAVFIRDKNGEVRRVVGAMTDLTRKKEYEESLKQLNIELEQHAKELAASNAELEQFAFVASHDLQEPLRMITSFLAQLERKYGDELDDRAKKYIHFATDGAKRMRQIILDLLDYSRVGRLHTDREEVDLNEILTIVKGLHKKLIEEKKASVTWDEMPVIYAAGSPVQQLFQNLIHNALNYQDKGNKPVIKIRAEETDSHWKFFVKDNGIGIDPEYKDKIFNIFQRLHGRDEYSGTGVGLAICKKIVEDHGGTIEVESEVDEGSVFIFTIPKKKE